MVPCLDNSSSPPLLVQLLGRIYEQPNVCSGSRPLQVTSYRLYRVALCWWIPLSLLGVLTGLGTRLLLHVPGV
eukprot:41005-Lingulodinium_polyedra.AAC.1